MIEEATPTPSRPAGPAVPEDAADRAFAGPPKPIFKDSIFNKGIGLTLIRTRLNPRLPGALAAASACIAGGNIGERALLISHERRYALAELGPRFRLGLNHVTPNKYFSSQKRIMKKPLLFPNSTAPILPRPPRRTPQGRGQSFALLLGFAFASSANSAPNVRLDDNDPV